MCIPSRGAAGRLVLAGLCLPLFTQILLAQSQVRQVKVLSAKGAVEIEVEASDRITPQTQVLTGPDRLVVDFPNSVPGGQLRSQSVNLGQVKDVRVGLFQSNPPVTRVVLDLRAAQSFQVFPYGRTVMIKVSGNPSPDASTRIEEVSQAATQPGLVTANYTTAREPIVADAPAKPPLEVSFRNGQLRIHATKATLSDVLFAVQQRTGAEISTPPGAEQEKVVADLGPGPAQEVLARLLNGSRFNFLILNSVGDPTKLDRVILSPRVAGANVAPSPTAQAQDDSGEDESPPAPLIAHPEPTGIPATQPPPPPAPRTDVPPPTPEEDSPEQ